MFWWLSGVENCVCSHARNHTSLWETDFEVNESYPGVPGLKGPLPREDVDDLSESPGRFRGNLPPGPKMRAVPTYAAAETEAMIGDPLLSGNLMQIKLEESVQQMAVSLYANGFSMTPISGGTVGEKDQRSSRAWSPFSLVEKCQVKTLQHSAYWAVFKLTIFRAGGHDHCLYFACTGANAYKERDKWVEKIGFLVSQVTLSLFPLCNIAVQPLPGVEATRTRIMAGFLLQGCSWDTCQVVYSELHAYSGGEARLSLYRDEWCDREVASISLSDSSTVSTRTGAHCNVFGIDHHRFCARSADEKDLWLRAVSNIKVKLMFEAPDPTAEELAIFRGAVRERVEELLRSTPRGASASSSAADGSGAPPPALLAEVTRLPPMSPRGDALDPEPIEDPAETSPPAASSTPQSANARDGGAGSGDVAAGPAAAASASMDEPAVERWALQRSKGSKAGGAEESPEAGNSAVPASASTPVTGADVAASCPADVGDEVSDADSGAARSTSRSNGRIVGPGTHKVPLQMEATSNSSPAAETEFLPGEGPGALAARLPRVKAAGRTRDEATHQAILHTAAVAGEGQAMSSTALAPAKPQEANASRQGPDELPHKAQEECVQPLCRQTALEGPELSEKALDCISGFSGAQPRPPSPRPSQRNGIAI